MPAFETDVDIINRGLQIIGKPRIVRVTEHNDAAREAGFAYDKLREAELSANLWSFATRRSVLRAIDTTVDLWTPAAWASGTTYALGAIVTYNDEWWQSKVASNAGNTPAIGNYWRHYFGQDTTIPHDVGTTYYAGEIVDSGGVFYLSLVSSNDVTPPSAGNWLVLGGTSSALTVVYPIGAGPGTNTSSANIFRRPRGFFRQAPSNPKAGTVGYVGYPTGHRREDWVFEGGYVVTGDAGPIMFRYVADMIDVPDFHPLFCEVLAARLGYELAPPLHADLKERALARRDARECYRLARSRAISQNGIEIGPVDPEIDTLISARL